MNVLLIKTLKRVAYLTPLLLLFLVFNNFSEYIAQKESQTLSIQNEQKNLDKKTDALLKLKKDYND